MFVTQMSYILSRFHDFSSHIMFSNTTAQSKVDKKRDKLERKVLDSQERAFWDVFRPMPNCINTTEVDIKKAYRKGGSTLGSGSGSTKVHQNYSVEQLTRHVNRKSKCFL